jgi:flagellar protein FlaG
MSISRIINSIPVEAQLQIGREVRTSTRKGSVSKSGDQARMFEIKNPSTNETTTVGELELIKAIERASKQLEPEFISLQYSRHEQTGIMMLKVINRDTHEIIREIPPEKILDIIGAIWDMVGIIVDKKV